MANVLLVAYLLIVVALIVVILLQRSEGGALGIGGGGGGGLVTARGSANLMTRTTAILATLFFVLALGMGIIARWESQPTAILDRIPGTTGTGGVLDSLGGAEKPAEGSQQNQGTENNTTNQTPVTTGTDAVPTEGGAATGTGNTTTTTDTGASGGASTGTGGNAGVQSGQ